MEDSDEEDEDDDEEDDEDDEVSNMLPWPRCGVQDKKL